MGRRKKTTFGWVRDDESPDGTASVVDDTADEPGGRVQGVVHREAMDDLSDLVLGLARLAPAVRKTLPLDEETLEQIEILASLGFTPARRRQALRVRLFLRDVDRAPLDAIVAGRSPNDDVLHDAERWRARLVAGTDEDLQAFVDAHPGSDRQEMRTAIRDARGEGVAASRAAKRLFQLLKAAMETTPAP